MKEFNPIVELFSKGLTRGKESHSPIREKLPMRRYCSPELTSRIFTSTVESSN